MHSGAPSAPIDLGDHLEEQAPVLPLWDARKAAPNTISSRQRTQPAAHFASISGARTTPVFAADGTFTVFEDSGTRTLHGIAGRQVGPIR